MATSVLHVSQQPPTTGGTALVESARRRSRQSGLHRLLRVRLAGFALAIILVSTAMAILAPLLAPYDPAATSGDLLAGPSPRHLLGTDQLGHDVLSQLVFGARISLAVGVGAIVLGMTVGGLLGLVSGYARGVADEVLMRLVDALVAFPGLILALALASALGPSERNLIIAIGVANVPFIARVARSQALQVRETDYVLAARAAGAAGAHVVRQHVFPNSLGPIVVQSTLGLGYAVLAAATLSFLGVGVPPPTPSWGGMLQQAFGLLNQDPLLAIVPATAIFLLVLAFNLLGDALRDVLDPRQRALP
jgi:ABC-type dipeptide/oligopeptide/nickel transport system permease subunit